MRSVAVIAAIAVAMAAATLPASLVTIHGNASGPDLTTASQGDGDRDGIPDEPSQSEPEEDDDLDGRDDDVDELLAVVDAMHLAFVRAEGEASWPAHRLASPPAPHPELSLRPPIAC